MSRRFDMRDHAGKIILGAPVLAVATAFAISLGISWYVTYYGGRVVSPVVVAMIVLPAVTAALGSGTGGLLLRRTLPVRVAAAVGGAAFGLAAYFGLAIAVDALMQAFGF